MSCLLSNMIIMIRVSLKQLTNFGGGGGGRLLLEGFLRLKFWEGEGGAYTWGAGECDFMASCVEYIRIEFKQAYTFQQL